MATIGEAAQGNATGRLAGKDYITLALFSVLLFVVFLAFSIVFGLNAHVFWFTHACASLVGGIAWMYVAAKVPKRGAFAVVSVIAAVIGLLMSMLWTGPAGIFVGGLLAELVAGAGSKRTTLRCSLAFAVWTLCFWGGQIAMVFASGESYVQMVTDSGMSAEYARGLIDFVYSPILAVAAAATILCPLVGGWIGAKLFKKHFAKIAA